MDEDSTKLSDDDILQNIPHSTKENWGIVLAAEGGEANENNLICLQFDSKILTSIKLQKDSDM